MKRFPVLFVLLTIFSSNVFADTALGRNPILRFVAEIRILREVALYTLIEERCARYMKSSERNSCYEAVDQKITLLDFDVLMGADKKTPVLLDKTNPSSFVFVAFRKDFIRLLSEQKTESYLETVNQEMTKFLVGGAKSIPNLWEITLAHYGSEYEAARALAVLFQDTSNVKLHLAYLEISGAQGTTSWFDSNRELLGRTIDTMNMVLDANRDSFQDLFYPRTVQGKLHRTIYHFYVPTYLSLALKKKGVPERFAFIAPFMMTLTYEFVTSAQDFRYLFADPKRLAYDSPADAWKVGDIFGSYNGVSFGMGRMDRVQKLEDIRRAFDISTLSGVQLLLK